MNQNDQRRWDGKYRGKEPSSEITPDPLLIRCLQGIVPGRALEIACGYGDNAIAMAQKGLDVTAIDISEVALRRAKERAKKNDVNVNFLLADAEEFDFGNQTYDMISGFYFLSRPLFFRIKRGLKEGGLFLYKTYTVDELFYRPGLNKDYLLEQGELRRFFEDFSVLLYDERNNGKECSARIIARR
jgi:tellurite methyltransferase